MSLERGTDYERRGLWLGLAVALVIGIGGGGTGFFGTKEAQVWLFIGNRVALGLSLLLCLLLVVPDVRARLGPRFRSAPAVFAWAFGFLVLGLLLAIAAGIEAAIDALDEDLPFN